MGLLPSIAIAGYWEHHPPEALIAGSRERLRCAAAVAESEGSGPAVSTMGLGSRLRGSDSDCLTSVPIGAGSVVAGVFRGMRAG